MHEVMHYLIAAFQRWRNTIQKDPEGFFLMPVTVSCFQLKWRIKEMTKMEKEE